MGHPTILGRDKDLSRPLLQLDFSIPSHTFVLSIKTRATDCSIRLIWTAKMSDTFV